MEKQNYAGMDWFCKRSFIRVYFFNNALWFSKALYYSVLFHIYFKRQTAEKCFLEENLFWYWLMDRSGKTFNKRNGCIFYRIFHFSCFCYPCFIIIRRSRYPVGGFSENRSPFNRQSFSRYPYFNYNRMYTGSDCLQNICKTPEGNEQKIRLHFIDNGSASFPVWFFCGTSCFQPVLVEYSNAAASPERRSFVYSNTCFNPIPESSQ